MLLQCKMEVRRTGKKYVFNRNLNFIFLPFRFQNSRKINKQLSPNNFSVPRHVNYNATGFSGEFVAEFLRISKSWAVVMISWQG